MTSRFKTRIAASDEVSIAAPPERVWRVLADVQAYPEWYPKSLRLRVLTTGPGLMGTDFWIHPAGGKPFRCRVEEVVEPSSIRLRYHAGIIEGTGAWHLSREGNSTRVTYTIDVWATGLLVAIIGKIVDLPGLHSRPMQEVLRNLARVVG